MASSRIPWIITESSEEDSDKLGYIGWNAFDNSAINEYLRPRHKRLVLTDEQKTKAASKRMRNWVHNPHALCMQAIDPEDPSKIAGFAVWAPANDPADAVPKEAQGQEKGAQDFERDFVATERFERAFAEKANEIMRGRTYYNLRAIATHPDHKRKGVASALLRWGLQEAEKAGLPMLIGSVPEARPVYAANGLKEQDTFTLDWERANAAGEPTGEIETILLYMFTKEIA